MPTLFAKEWIKQFSPSSDMAAAVGFALGLELCAMVRYDLDDIHSLWQAPHIPE